MLYSDFIKTDAKIITALKAAGVSDTPSIMKEDFHIPSDFLEPIRERIIDFEVLTRRSAINHEAEMKELNEARLQQAQKHPDWKAFKEWEKNQPDKEKVSHIRPFVEKLVTGNLHDAFSANEQAVINVLSESIAQRYDYEPGEAESTHVDTSGLSELQAILKRAGVTRLSHKMSLEEIALRGVADSQISKFLKK